MDETSPLLNPDGPVGLPRGQAIDWGASLALHDRWLRTAVLARLGERQAVEEVMQEVALAAVAQQAPLSDATKVGPWLYRLAIRRVLLYRRHRGRQSRLLGLFAGSRGDHAIRTHVSDPLDWLMLDERRQFVREALGRLVPRDAEILLLKYTEDWSYRELAAHLGIGEAAVEARLYRARQRLREAMTGSNSLAIEVAE